MGVLINITYCYFLSLYYYNLLRSLFAIMLFVIITNNWIINIIYYYYVSLVNITIRYIALITFIYTIVY